MQSLILHPKAATAVPVTHVKAGRKGKPVKAKAQRDMTREQLAEFVKARGLKALTKHTKAKLRQMIATGVQVRPAAQDRDNAARKAKRAKAGA